MEFRIPYGHSYLPVQIPDDVSVDIIKAPDTPRAKDPLGVVQNALENLLGESTWSDFAGAKSVGIAVNDKTRPVPHQHLLPPLFEKLAEVGISDEAVTLYIAGGSHPPMTPVEYPVILPDDVLQRFTVISHDAEDPQSSVYLGETSRGTPIWANRCYLQSDLKIVIGNIEPHQFVGFSGGVKSAAIGLAGIETINRNHALLTQPDSQLGEYKINPARQDVEEIGQKIGVHLALNAILNQHKQIVYALAGDPIAVMRSGVSRSQQVCQVAVSQKYGLTIVSPGGYPKDINVYQSQKGLAHAAQVTRRGGTIILVAACPEGSGSPHYEDWAEGKTSYAEVIQKFQEEGFRIGPHKAYQIARDASQFRLKLYSKMKPNLARKLLLEPVEDLQTAVDSALVDLGQGELVAVLPHAASTIPYLS